jgi:DNA-binding phage protein
MPMPSGKQPSPSPLAREFSAHVRMVMARDHVTMQALADAAGISRTYLGKRLRDEVPFTLNDVEAISKALRIDLPKLPDL